MWKRLLAWILRTLATAAAREAADTVAPPAQKPEDARLNTPSGPPTG